MNEPLVGIEQAELEYQEKIDFRDCDMVQDSKFHVKLSKSAIDLKKTYHKINHSLRKTSSGFLSFRCFTKVCVYMGLYGINLVIMN
ncbi:hypothetical protein BpHYR1_022054 [Brachionus plicatilis]|uniref:Uncharacterized protein n=1 Tax=Brachionus plicatilis TaxID=10195 RepID=A0A3M7P2B9_BRAPC|nr:hypothetical protein BpHYR1_022054 [Brachionus plicatilis]